MYTWHPNSAFAGETGFFISICPLNDSNPDDGCGVTFAGRFSFGPASSSSTISTTSTTSSASTSSLSSSRTTHVQSSIASSQITSSSQTTTSSQTPTVTSSPSHELSTGAVAAISAVVPITAVAAAILVVYMLWRKRKAHPNKVAYAGEEHRKAELPSESRGVSGVKMYGSPTQDRKIAETQGHGATINYNLPNTHELE